MSARLKECNSIDGIDGNYVLACLRLKMYGTVSAGAEPDIQLYLWYNVDSNIAAV
jgi:hypothetical protein